MLACLLNEMYAAVVQGGRKENAMQKYFITLFLGFIFGTITGWVAVSLIQNLIYKKNSDIIWTSSDTEQLDLAASKLIETNRGIMELFITLQGITDGREATPEAKLIVLDMINNMGLHHFTLLGLSGSANIIANKEKHVRIKGLKTIDQYFSDAFHRVLLFMTKTLHIETDEEVRNLKISLICKYLGLGQNGIQEMFPDGNIQEIQVFLRSEIERILDTEIKGLYSKQIARASLK